MTSAYRGTSPGTEPQRRFDLVILDCDGVVIDSEVIAARTLVDELSGHGIAIDLAYVARHCLGRSTKAVLARLAADFGFVPPADFEATLGARLFAGFARGLAPVAGLRPVIEALAVPYHLATSSSPERLAGSLDMAGLADLFAGRTATASEVPRGKPAPDLFLSVAARCGVAPGRCLVIEDSLPGVAAGRAAGMTTWRFTGGSHLAGQVQEPPPPEAERWHAAFASWDEFFHLAPDLRQVTTADGATERS